MKLIIYNGSPRGQKSNTKLLMEEFIKGLSDSEEYELEMYYIVKRKDHRSALEAYAEAENVIFAFPLYTDSMPGIVKDFIELLHPYSNLEKGPAMGFVVQSGFPEPAHSRYIEKYLEQFAKRMNSPYLGTIVKGGVEGIQIMPGWMTKKLYKRFFDLGQFFAKTGQFDRKIMKKLAPKERMSKGSLWFFKIMRKTRMGNFYWDSQMKKNGVFDIRFDKPFA
ncbi:NAD(P)H-dependent oxidoreductase [Bacteroidota bacterium]